MQVGKLGAESSPARNNTLPACPPHDFCSGCPAQKAQKASIPEHMFPVSHDPHGLTLPLPNTLLKQKCSLTNPLGRLEPPPPGRMLHPNILHAHPQTRTHTQKQHPQGNFSSLKPAACYASRSSGGAGTRGRGVPLQNSPPAEAT